MFNVGDVVIRADVRGRKRYRIVRFAQDGSGWIYAVPEGGGATVTFVSPSMLKPAGVGTAKARRSGGGMPRGSLFEDKVAEVVALRPDVSAEFVPLFDHLVVLARDSQARGHAQRAGVELAKARKIAAERPRGGEASAPSREEIERDVKRVARRRG